MIKSMPVVVILSIIVLITAMVIQGCLGSGGGGGYDIRINCTLAGYVFVPAGSLKASSAPTDAPTGLSTAVHGLTGSLSGENTVIHPRAVASPDGMVPLAGAVVRLNDRTRYTTTDSSGYYALDLVIENDTVKTVEVLSGTTLMVYFHTDAQLNKTTVSSVKISGTPGSWEVKEIVTQMADDEQAAEDLVQTIVGGTFEFSGLVSATDREVGGELDLAWNPAEHSDTSVSYRVYMDRTSGGQVFESSPFIEFQDVSGGRVSGLQNAAYYFVVRAVSAGGRVEDTPNTVELSVTVTDQTDPSWTDAAGIQALALGDEQVTVYWNPATDNTAPVSYRIYYHTSSPATAGEMVAVTAPSASSTYAYEHTITGLTNGTVYYCMIRALDGAHPPNEEDNTQEGHVAPGAPASAPSLVSAVQVGAAVELHWAASTDGGGLTITGYKVYRGISSPDTVAGTTDAATLTLLDDDPALTVGKLYMYQVVAVTAAGDGERSNYMSVNFK